MADSKTQLKENLLAHIPAELRASCCWMLWRLEDTDKPRAKVPKQLDHPESNLLDWTNPGHLSPFNICVAALPRIKPIAKYEGEQNPCGIGLLPFGPLIAVDFDDCRNPETGAVEPWAAAAIKSLNSYTELSPSEKGFHVWLRVGSQLPKDVKRTFNFHHLDPADPKRSTGELVLGKKYLTVTGLWVEGTSREVRELDPSEVSLLCQQYGPRAAAAEKPKERKSAVSNKLELLEAGKWEAAGFDEVNKAVQSFFVQLILRYKLQNTKTDRDLLGWKFERSGLCRNWTGITWPEDWSNNGAKWPRLRENEFDKAFAISVGSAPAESRALDIKKDTEIEATVIDWLAVGMFPLGKEVLAVGDGGIGKSLAFVDFIARYTTGKPFPNGKACLEPGEVLLFSAEDDFADTIKPRLIVAGYKPGTVHFVKGTKAHGQVALDTDLEQIREHLKANPKIKLVIFDPLSSYFGKKDMNRMEQARAILDPVGSLAAEMRITVVLIHHFSKNIGLDAAKKSAGSIAIVSAARIAWGFFRDPDNEKLVHMLAIKSNVTDIGQWKGWKYQVKRENHPVNPEDAVGIPKIDWIGGSDKSADDVAADHDDKDFSQTKKCVVWLREFLAKRRRKQEVDSAANAEGYTAKMLRTASERLKVKKSQEGSQHFWELKKEETEPGMFQG